MYILPFANEIANSITISKVGAFKRLYKPCSIRDKDRVRSIIIDSIALIGILWNTAYIASKLGTRAGCIYGIIILFLSFIIPNTTMESVVNYLCSGHDYPCSPKIKLMYCLLFILVLIIFEMIASRLLKATKWKYSR